MHLVSVFIDNMNPRWRKEEKATSTDMLILIIQGKVTYILEGEQFLLEKGDFLYVKQGVLRTGSNAPDGPHLKYSAHFYADGRDGGLEVDTLAEFGKYRKVKVRQFDYVKQRFSVLAQHWFGRRKHSGLLCTGIATELLGCFAQETSEERFVSGKLRLMHEVRDYITSHYREQVCIEDLSRLVDRTPNYVTQSFKETTGMTPIAYLHHVRVYAARDLILNTKMTMGEIAEFLGYCDQAYFNRVFKKIMGCPPSSVLSVVVPKKFRPKPVD